MQNMIEGMVYAPKELRSEDDFMTFENSLLGYPTQKKYSELEKIQMKKRAMLGPKTGYKRLNASYWMLEFMDIPFELVKSVEFVSEYKIAITFFETEEFCIEKYFQSNFDIIKDKIFSIKYLNKEGYAVRTDSYTVVKLVNVEKSSLTNEVKDITFKITLECSNHGISTCKE